MKRHDESISDRLRRMAATDELKVGRGRAEQIAARALARVESRPRQRARLVAAIVSGSAFAIVSATGVGAIADQAVPGDSLYPVDRAYESIGRVIGRDTDRTQERLEEALALVQRGDRVAAANHVNTELSQRIPVIELPDDGIDADPSATTTVVVPEDDSSDDQAVVAAAESTPTTSPAAEPPSAELQPVEERVVEPEVDPFLLAIENALRATQAAVGTDDVLIAAEADEALRSVVKLAAGATEDASGTSQEVQAAPGAVSVRPTTTTTTTTTPTTTVARGNNGNGQGNSTTTTTTTSVPDDPVEGPPGDGETAGDDSGGSQEGSGSAGEPGDAGDESPGPVILPIP